MRNGMARTRSDRDYNLPRIIMNGEPVLDLFLFNIGMRISRQRVRLLLDNFDLRHIEILETSCKGTYTTAILRAPNLASSTEIQVRSALKELTFTYASGHTTALRVVPLASRAIAEPPPELSPSASHSRVIHALNSCDVARIIAENSNGKDFLNLFEAAGRPASFISNCIDIDAANPRYDAPGGLARITSNQIRAQLHADPPYNRASNQPHELRGRCLDIARSSKSDLP